MKLIITSPGTSPREMKLASSASIGRSADNTIHIDDTSVARYHAMIELRPNGFWLNDLGSMNGTVVNGAQIAAATQLKNGDLISLGNSAAIKIMSPEAQTASAAAPTTDHPSASASVAGAEIAPSTPPPEAGVPLTHVAVAGITVFVLLAFVGVALWIINHKKDDPTTRNQPPLDYTPTPTKTVVPSPSAKPTEGPGNPNPSVTSNVGTYSLALASQLSGKSNYVFEPRMLEQISLRTKDYVVDVSQEIEQHKLKIDQNFSQAKGLNPLLGYVLAMSQSKFGKSLTGNGIGLWQLPPAIAQGFMRTGEDLSALHQPERAADVTAAYVHSLMNSFQGEDFMYAIACYGLSISEAGKLNQRLQELDPAERRNFWKLYEQGIISKEGGEKVLRFFAAGIVGEHPADFGLSQPPFSES